MNFLRERFKKIKTYQLYMCVTARSGICGLIDQNVCLTKMFECLTNILVYIRPTNAPED